MDFNREDFKGQDGILRMYVTKDIPYDGVVPYLEWEHRDVSLWIHELEIVKGEINSQRFVKYDKNGRITDCFSSN